MLKAYERQHRIELVHRTWRENDTTNELESQEKPLTHAWAAATPLLHRGKFQGFYHFVMHKSVGRDARHACANALRWNRKVLTITSRCDQEDRFEVWAKEGDTCQTTGS